MTPGCTTERLKLKDDVPSAARVASRFAYEKGDIGAPTRPGGQGNKRQHKQMRDEARKRRKRYMKTRMRDRRKALIRWHTKMKRKPKVKERRKRYKENPERYRRRAPKKYVRPDPSKVAARFSGRSGGDIILYDQWNPANDEIKQPGLDVNYRATSPTTYERFPDDRMGVPAGVRPPSNQTENVPPASSRVIPEAMKETLRQQLTYVRAQKQAAATIPEIMENCGPMIHMRSQGLNYRRKRLAPSGMSTWIVTGSTGDLYTVRLKPIRKDKRVKMVIKMPVKVSCTCEFFRWQGPEHWAKVNDFLYGKARGTASFPIIRDPKSKHWVCKHVMVVLRLAQKWRRASEEVWSYDGPLAPLPEPRRVAARYRSVAYNRCSLPESMGFNPGDSGYAGTSGWSGCPDHPREDAP